MFSLSRIRGGIHPEEHKLDSVSSPIMTDLPLPNSLMLPLGQHAGAEAIPLVKVGDKVAKGQLIAAKGPGSVSANLHAPTSGVVTEIEMIQAPHPSGLCVTGIIIEPDGDHRWLETPEETDPFQQSPDDLAAKVERAGIVGMGGAIFPAAIKLRQGRRFEIKTLLINGSECEPYLTADDRLMRERAADIIDGARLVRYILESYRVVIAIENNKPEAIAALTKAAAEYGSIEIVTVPTQYPTGSAKQLIQAVTGEEVPAGGRSNDLGILVHNVATIYAIQQALRYNRPLLSRITTVAGGCVAQPRNVEVLLGTPVSHVLDACGGLTKQPDRLLLGGPMMGQVLPSTQVPVTKGTTGILALNRKEVNDQMPSPCIRCGRCVDTCPMGLVPLEMVKHTKADDFDRAQYFGLNDCILCGSCSYVCPSHIPLVQYFEYGKGTMRLRKSNESKLKFTMELTANRSDRLAAEAEAKKAAKKNKKSRRVKKEPAPETLATNSDAEEG